MIAKMVGVVAPALVAILLPLAGLRIAPRAAAQTFTTETATWDAPDLDRWLHQGQVTPGVKGELSSFTNFGVTSPDSQGRAGVAVFAFDTSDQVEQVAPERYRIDAVRFRATAVSKPGSSVPYDPTRDLLADIAAGTDDAGKPVELYGVGFDNGYTKFGFGPNDAQGPEFEEASPQVTAGAASVFNIFPLGDDGQGGLGNVFNSPGGEGQFVDGELVEVTRDPWDPQPWAIGMVDGMSAGELLTGRPVFEFSIDLNVAGVLDYFQQTLSTGQVGVALSSLHDLSGFHDPSGESDDFPVFSAKEDIAVQFGVADPAALEIDYTILPLPGDYDASGEVASLDYAQWRATFGQTVEPFTAADGDGDGVVGGTDYAIWRENLPPPAQQLGVETITVPESSPLVLIALALIVAHAMGFLHRAA